MSVNDSRITDDECFYHKTRETFFQILKDFVKDVQSFEGKEVFAVCTIMYMLPLGNEKLEEFTTLTTLAKPLVEPLDEWYRKNVAQPVLRFKSRFLDSELLFMKFYWK